MSIAAKCTCHMSPNGFCNASVKQCTKLIKMEEKKYPIDDWSNYLPMMSNVQDRTGISIEWQKLWSEIENWYGDPKKRETGEQFLKRMQATYFTLSEPILTEEDVKACETSTIAAIPKSYQDGYTEGWDACRKGQIGAVWVKDEQPAAGREEDWIDVNNKLPEVGDNVMIYNTEGATLIGYRVEGEWVAFSADGEKIMGELTATHWRPLPAPPQFKQQNITP